MADPGNGGPVPCGRTIHSTAKLVYIDANCENRTIFAIRININKLWSTKHDIVKFLMAVPVCYRGDDWCTIGYFSATTALLVMNGNTTYCWMLCIRQCQQFTECVEKLTSAGFNLDLPKWKCTGCAPCRAQHTRSNTVTNCMKMFHRDSPLFGWPFNPRWFLLSNLFHCLK